ncbi:hypothetical protein GCM10009541_55910 [Micromonospora gifhornensis]|uniref:Uncharacterized protein n=1 Tax=Micromonospora gifhornensis TaxID=84594 RepID=A0ABQ4ILZ6_9ACTN|nr:hypothetical protein Vgi01_56220 [Micromonospora gifhornensis]
MRAPARPCARTETSSSHSPLPIHEDARPAQRILGMTGIRRPTPTVTLGDEQIAKRTCGHASPCAFSGITIVAGTTGRMDNGRT